MNKDVIIYDSFKKISRWERLRLKLWHIKNRKRIKVWVSKEKQ